MRNLLKIMVLAAGLILTGCATDPVYRQEPHHFSKDMHGKPVACFEAGPNEYDCIPVVRRSPVYATTYNPYWPAWTLAPHISFHHHRAYCHRTHPRHWRCW